MEIVSHTDSSFRVLVFVLVFALGVLISSFVFISPLISLMALAVAGAVFLAEKLFSNKVSQEVFIIFIILASFGLGTLRYSAKDFHEEIIPTSHGVVVSEPEEKDNYKRFVFLSDNGAKALVNVALYSDVKYGDEVRIGGRFKAPENFVNEDTGRVFDYKKYLSKDDIYYILNSYELEILSHGHGNLIKALLLKIKNTVVNQSKEILPEPFASLLNGLIVSGREAMPKSILEEFRRAGVVHIVVLSGFNITLIAEFIRRLFRSRYAPVLGVIAFVVMTGAESSIVRAAIMALVATGGKVLHQEYSARRALVFTAFLMIIHNPKILVFDPSFQLSFLATLGLVYLMNPIEKKLNWVTERWKIRETLAQTLSTQLAVLPLLIYIAGDVSLVSIPANLLTLLIVPYTMLVGFVAILISFVSSLVALPLTYAAYLLLKWVIFVAHTLGALPFATIKIPSISLWVIFIIYLTLFIRGQWPLIVRFLPSRNFPRHFSN